MISFSRIFRFFFDFFHSLFGLFFDKFGFSLLHLRFHRSHSTFFIQWPLDSLTAFNESEIRWRCTLVHSIYMHSTGQGKIPDAYYTITYKKWAGVHWVKEAAATCKKMYSKSPSLLDMLIHFGSGTLAQCSSSHRSPSAHSSTHFFYFKR